MSKGKYIRTPEIRKKMSEAGKGNIISEETKNKISKALKGRIFSLEHREKIGKAGKGKILSKESKNKMSITIKNKLASPIIRMKMNIAHKGKRLSEETKRKMSIIRKGRTFSKEHRKKLSESHIQGITSGRIKLKCIYRDTTIEITMGEILTKLNIKFIPQCFIKEVRCYADFFLPNNNILIECDGDFWHNSDKQKRKDINRDLRASFAGYKTLRFWEHEINKEPERCIKIIKQSLRKG